MNEKEDVINTINAYIKRLEDILNNIDTEISSKYFNLSCIGGDIECASLHLLRKYHKKYYQEE